MIRETTTVIIQICSDGGFVLFRDIVGSGIMMEKTGLGENIL